MTSDLSPVSAVPRVRGVAILVIGDEILSGRTQDTNSNYIARWLGQLGLKVAEIRVVSDVEDEIVESVRRLSAKFDFVLTTGGIGPTHDDITADAMAKAFSTGIGYHPVVFAQLARRYEELKAGPFNEARQRMARIPYGASLIANPLSSAPGFQIGNVFVMAGVPAVMQAMLADVRTRLPVARALKSVTVSAYLSEGTIAAALEGLQKKHPDLPLGSYPFAREGRFGTSLVARGTDAERLAGVRDELTALVRAHGGEVLPDPATAGT